MSFNLSFYNSVVRLCHTREASVANFDKRQSLHDKGVRLSDLIALVDFARSVLQ